jgi:hypothetical protein
MFLDESARYLVVMGEFEKAFKLIDKMIKRNKNENYKELSEKEKEGLTEWEVHLAEETPDDDIASVPALFKKGYRLTTCILWFGYVVNNIIYYGVTYMIPIIVVKLEGKNASIGQENKDLGKLTISLLIESLSVLVAVVLIDVKWIGRKTFMIIFYALTIVISITGLFHVSTTAFIVWVTMIKIFSNILSYFFYLYTMEIYPTKYRATGLGIASAVGKLATIGMPYIISPLIDAYIFLPFGLFIILSVITSLAVLKLPAGTSGKDLQ